MLGDSSFSYGFKLYDAGNTAYSLSNGNGVSVLDMQQLEITAEGIIITGFLANGELGLILKNDTVTQSYGVY